MRMRILDRERYWAFFKAYLICFVALVGLYVVIDAFTNLDEFTEVREGTIPILRYMGWYYSIRMFMFYDQLCGVITMMAAIFTVTWMQRNNELLAMLAAGISTQRVIRPVLIAAVLVSALAVVNQEVVMPQFGEELLKSADDDGQRRVLVAGRFDLNQVFIHAKDGDRLTETLSKVNVSIPASPSLYGVSAELTAIEATYISPDDSKAPMRGGWLLRGARLTPTDLPLDSKTGLLWRLDAKDLTYFPPPVAPAASLTGDAFFLQTNLSFTDLTRNRHWFQFANTHELITGLSNPANDPEELEIRVFLHVRILRPLLGLTLLFLSLPLVLGGESRNMFINLGLSLGTSAIFYTVLFITKYLAENSVVAPALAGWGPLAVFGTVAAARWDSIRS
ncbi:MAG TPA: LptF/LptG family permease [Isosphaeraceae bacterium]|jgi:lipopolysaccharide export system permease protein|nr:LptF/LptG family permease [Isosphaeraceae bacterium]